MDKGFLKYKLQKGEKELDKIYDSVTNLLYDIKEIEDILLEEKGNNISVDKLYIVFDELNEIQKTILLKRNKIKDLMEEVANRIYKS